MPPMRGETQAGRVPLHTLAEAQRARSYKVPQNMSCRFGVAEFHNVQTGYVKVLHEIARMHASVKEEL